jgi:hypothetical protein
MNIKNLLVSAFIVFIVLLFFRPIRCRIWTSYPKDYKSENFEKIVVGMGRNEVIKLIGKPFATLGDIASDSFDSLMIYSMPNAMRIDYSRKEVLIKEKKVIRIIDFCGCYD